MHKFHPIADCFPLIEGDEFNDLVTDIKANGLLERIVLYEGMILDGRNRERACELAGVAPEYEQYKGDKPIKFAISKNSIRRHINSIRRHMTTSQRALAASELETLEHGGNRQDANLHLDPIRSEIAADMKVSPRSVATAKTIKAPDLKEAVKTGKKSVNAAAKEQKARVTTKKDTAPINDKTRAAATKRKRQQFWAEFRTRLNDALAKTKAAIDRFETDPKDRPEKGDWYEVAVELSQETERLHKLHMSKATK
jgi:hypothetical protein